MKIKYICFYLTWLFLISVQGSERISLGISFAINENQLSLQGTNTLTYDDDNFCSLVISDFGKEKLFLYKDFKFVSIDAIDDSIKVKLSFKDKSSIYFRVFLADGEYYMEKIDVNDFLNLKKIIDAEKLKNYFNSNPKECRKANLRMVKLVSFYKEFRQN